MTVQIETATIIGTITGDGNAVITVTAVGMTNSPKAINVAVVSGDVAADVALKVRQTLALDADVQAFFLVSGATDKSHSNRPRRSHERRNHEYRFCEPYLYRTHRRPNQRQHSGWHTYDHARIRDDRRLQSLDHGTRRNHLDRCGRRYSYRFD